MTSDPVESNPDHYRVIFENERVRVLEYRDAPGQRTSAHHHPDSVMITASAFRRRLESEGRQLDVELPALAVRWLPAQEHSGENTGGTDTHAFFVELKEPSPGAAAPGRPALGPDAPEA
ncbi:cytoplasmic protein [Arthrobacter sp. zg-Y820]|uniref:cytoplasmic protein n=1 Tax=unclassified Arthrobacter TaxID=235627 RepID=UPI001E4537CE|nr:MULTISPECIES: cytoplasmic protein [unclassified Arthrobacter]MCC9195360.1 cytoplasmic protein [Arthrobacter sp. zg-Y820]MDK1278219.1 cytoplasmic protein [Arthrobacter sp. zg.Y820]MDK1361304.1 cytoplasmic protein [Arthrobacter sp. zg-Y1219]WIB10100.1 cytoplasmic protein [Arthrobacter sp. zg-Y820]